MNQTVEISNADRLNVVKIVKGGNPDQDEEELEALAMFVYSGKLKELEDSGRILMEEVSEGHKKIQHLHKILAKINELTDEDGEIKPNEELRDLFNDAKEMGIELDQSAIDKKKLDFHQKERLVENVKLVCDDFNLENDTKTQKVNHINNERFSVIQFIRKVLDTMQQTKQLISRKISGG